MPDESNDNATEVLFERGTLLDLFIGKPTFQKKLRPNDLLVEGIDPKAVYLGHKFLLSKKATERLTQIEGQARSTLADKSLEFPLSGARFVYYASLQDVLEEMRKLKTAWGVAVSELIRKYPDLKTEQLAVLDKQCETLAASALSKATMGRADLQKKLDSWVAAQKLENRSLYPSADSLPKMFSFEWRMFKVSGLTGMESMSSLQADDLLNAQNQLREDLQKWVRSAAVEMHKSLGDAAANALNLLNKNDKMQPRNLKPLFNAFETFKAVDFTGASSFQEVIDRMRSTFGVIDTQGELDYDRIADNLNNGPGMESFRKLLEKVSTLAVDKVAEEAGLNSLRSVGDLKRVIEV